jgi:hypothetical protein
VKPDLPEILAHSLGQMKVKIEEATFLSCLCSSDADEKLDISAVTYDKKLTVTTQE